MRCEGLTKQEYSYIGKCEHDLDNYVPLEKFKHDGMYFCKDCIHSIYYIPGDQSWYFYMTNGKKQKINKEELKKWQKKWSR